MSKGYRKYKIIVIFISILTILLSIWSEKAEGYEFITFIPLTYLLLFLGTKRIHFYSERYNGLLLLNGLMFLKYVVAILAICVTHSYILSSYYAVSITKSSYHWATLILIGEVISLFVIIELFSSSIYKNCNYNTNHEKEYTDIKVGPVLFSFIVMGIVLTILYPEEIFGSISILFSSENQLTETLESSHVLGVIFGAFKIIVMGMMINSCIIKYNNTGQKRYVFISYLFIIIHCLLNVSTSRMNIIIPFVLFAFITSKIFKKTGIYLNITIIVVLSIIIGIVSVYKMPWILVSQSPVLSFFSDFAKRLQEYTSNIMPTAMGLQAIEHYNSAIDFTTFFKDFFGSMPIVSSLFNENEMIYTLYNNYALSGLNNTQLIPMTISSIAYFTPALTYLLVDGCAILLMFLEKRNDYVRNNYLNDYLKLYLFFIFASCTFSNIQMISGRLFTNYIPTMIVLYLNREIGKGFKIKTSKKG